MSNDERLDQAGNDAFVERVRATFDESVSSLDAETRSRLNRRRHEALEAVAGEKRGLRPLAWLPATGAAAAVAIALLVVGNNSTVAPVIPAPSADIDILLDGDDLEMYEDLEFYSWIDLEPETAAHVG